MPRETHPRRVRIPPRRDVVTTESVPVGSLALSLRDAQRKLIDQEAQVDRLLDSLFGPHGWNNFEYGEALEIDVYDAVPSEASTHALHRAGFSTVTIHEHDRSKFTRCACLRVRRAS